MSALTSAQVHNYILDFKLSPCTVCFLLGNSPPGNYPEENIQHT